MEIDNLKDFSNILFKGVKPTIETSYLTFASILSMKMNQNKNAAWKNKSRNERVLSVSLFMYAENFFVACKQSQGNKQEQSESKNMA